MKKIFLLICLLTSMVCMQETNLFGLQTFPYPNKFQNGTTSRP